MASSYQFYKSTNANSADNIILLALFNKNTQPTIFIDTEYKIRFFNQAALEVSQKMGFYQPSLDMDFMSMIPARLKPLIQEKLSEALIQQECRFEITHQPKDGLEPNYYESHYESIYTEENEFVGLCIRGYDITEQKRVQKELEVKLKEALLLNRVILAASTSLDWKAALGKICEELAHFFDLPQAACALLNESQTELVVVAEYCAEGRPSGLGVVIPVENNEVTRRVLQDRIPVQVKQAQTDPRQSVIHDMQRMRGTVSLLVVPLMLQGTLVGTLGFDSITERVFTPQEIALVQNIALAAGRALENAQLYSQLQEELAERNRAEAALAAEKEQLAISLRSIGDGVITTDTQGQVVLINQAALELTGWTEAEALGQKLEDVYKIINLQTRQPVKNPFSEVLETNHPEHRSENLVLVSRNGDEHLVVDICTPMSSETTGKLGVVLVFSDITEKQRATEELLKSSKLEALGLLAGGIAHDFNNILTTIMINLSYLKNSLESDNPAYPSVDEANKATLRARDLTQQLLTFAKGGEPVKKITQLQTLVEESARFGLAGSNVQGEFSFAPNLWAAEVDSGQIGQVIQNLVLNAVQAMPDGGKITTKARNINLTKENGINLPDGNYVEITVKDTGPGIPPNYLQRIFDPYFTTKKEGSGLGLATCHAIVQKHEGMLKVETQVGKGTIFYLYLPAKKQKLSEKLTQKGTITPGKGRVLLMDDEPTIRKVSGAILGRLGYEVETAVDGNTAIEAYKEAQAQNKQFDVVIMDLTIPGGMGGAAAIQKLLEIDPKVKAIVSSGYSEAPIMSQYREHGFKGVVTKPYSIEELSRTLHDIISND